VCAMWFAGCALATPAGCRASKCISRRQEAARRAGVKRVVYASRAGVLSGTCAHATGWARVDRACQLSDGETADDLLCRLPRGRSADLQARGAANDSPWQLHRLKGVWRGARLQLRPPARNGGGLRAHRQLRRRANRYAVACRSIPLWSQVTDRCVCVVVVHGKLSITLISSPMPIASTSSSGQ
jgi:hypothetical protein